MRYLLLASRRPSPTSATRKMELEERRHSAENLSNQAKEARSEVIEEEQQARTYLSGWRLHVLTAG